MNEKPIRPSLVCAPVAMGEEVTYFQKRRAEILGRRKRKPRRCDLQRQEQARRERASQHRRQIYAARRLQGVWA